MKCIIVFIFLAMMSASAATMAQRVTLNEKNISLEKVFDLFRRQTGYNIVYSTDVLGRSKKTTLNLHNTPLEDALIKALEGQPLTYEIDGTTILIEEKAQPGFIDQLKAVLTAIDVTGRVTNDHNQPLSGATVQLKNGGAAATTDANGFFTLKNVQPNALIIISYIGYDKKELAATANVGQIKLLPATSKLDEVQVIAYGTSTERLNTGSVTVVKADEIEKNPVSNVLAALEGKVTGLQISQVTGVPGGDYKIMLRGANSITQNRDPLYIIDGIPFTSTSLTKLNDRSASVNSNPLENINPYDIESVTVLKDAAATAIYGARGANGVILITMKKGKAGVTKVDVNAYTGIGQNPRRIDLLNTPQYLAITKEALTNSGVPINPVYAPALTVFDQNKDTDWQKVFIGGTAHYRDIQASVSGGSAGTTFLIGAGNHRETTVFPGNNAANRTAVRFNINHNSPDGKFKVLLSGSYVSANTNMPAQDFTSYIYSTPNQPDPILPNGKLSFVYGASNPLVNLQRPYTSTTNNLLANSSVSYDILKGLQVKVNMGYNNIQSNEMQLIPLSSQDPSISTATSQSAFGNNSIKTWNIEPQISYTKAFGRHTLNVLMGSTFQSITSGSIRYDASGFVSDAFLPNIQAAKTVAISAFTNGINKYNSLFGRISYNWNEEYLLDLTARRDGSSRFSTANRFGNFGAAGFAWVFTKEQGVNNLLPFMSFGKVRVSYGTVGNSPSSDYNFLSQWSVVVNPYDGVSGLSPAKLFNPNFAWEVTRKFEVALDLEFFKGRINLSGSYYRNRSSDELVTTPLPAITGFTSILQNLPATVQNTGIELNLQTNNIKSKDFRWSSGFNVSVPRNKLVSFPNLAASTYANTFTVGQPIYVTRLYKYVDVDPQTGLYRFQGANGPTSSPSTLDFNYNYDATPKFYGGFENSFSYKNFSLDFFFQFAKQKGMMYTSGPNSAPYILDRWQKPGDITNVQKLESPATTTFFTSIFAQSSDRFVTDASYIRLKNLSISYSLSKSLLNSVHISGCRFYVQAQNLATITSYKGLDPETGNSVLPPLRVWSAGVQLTF